MRRPFKEEPQFCPCNVHYEPHKEHSKHFIAQRGNGKCPHWDIVSDLRFLTALERERTRLERKRLRDRMALRPRLVSPIIA